MSLSVSLRDFIDAMDVFGDEAVAHLNRLTGEFLTTTPDDHALMEEDEEDDIPDWQRERLPKVRDALSSDDWLQLPSKYDFDEYDIMRKFCESLPDRVFAADLADTIGGRGTFGRFKSMLHRHNVHEQWYRFRELALKEIAVAWLEANKIPYKDDLVGHERRVPEQRGGGGNAF